MDLENRQNESGLERPQAGSYGRDRQVLTNPQVRVTERRVDKMMLGLAQAVNRASARDVQPSGGEGRATQTHV